MTVIDPKLIIHLLPKKLRVDPPVPLHFYLPYSFYYHCFIICSWNYTYFFFMVNSILANSPLHLHFYLPHFHIPFITIVLLFVLEFEEWRVFGVGNIVLKLDSVRSLDHWLIGRTTGSQVKPHDWIEWLDCKIGLYKKNCMCNQPNKSVFKSYKKIHCS